MYTGIIYVGWYLSYHFFRYLNFKSLETLLVQYPDARFRLKIIAPKGHRQERYGELLSKPTILKYAKQGFDVTTVIQDEEPSFYKGTPAYRYWLDTFERSFKHNQSSIFIPAFAVDIFPAPYHLLMYDIFARLSVEGGVYADLSWLHLQPLPVLSRLQEGRSVAGYKMRIACHNAPLPSPNGPNNTRPLGYCRASGLFVLSKAHPVASCLLHQYSHPSFQQCLHDDLISQGAFCIERSLRTCFASTRSINALEERWVTDGHPIDNATCYVDHRRIHMHSRITSHNRRAIPASCRTLHRDHVDLLLDPPSNATQPPYRLGDHRRALWLNIAGFFPEWLVPEPSSLVERLIAQNNDQLKQLYRRRWHQNLEIADSAALDAYTQAATCHPYYVDGNDTLANRQRARMSCALTFVVPGFMKAASTYLFDSLAAHPWVVNALRGFDYKEAGCYTPDITANGSVRALRMTCYPFVEEQDQVVFGDGSIVYAPRRSVVTALLRDNPEVKVLFAVRDPIDRAMSLHRFEYSTYKSLGISNINECLHEVFGHRTFLVWRTLALNATRSQTFNTTMRTQFRHLLAERFYSDVQRLFRSPPAKLRCYRIVFDSLYFPQIFFWAQHVPRRNLRVVNMHKLQTSSLSTSAKEAALQETPIVDQFDLQSLFRSSLMGRSTDELVRLFRWRTDATAAITATDAGVDQKSRSVAVTHRALGTAATPAVEAASRSMFRPLQKKLSRLRGKKRLGDVRSTRDDHVRDGNRTAHPPSLDQQYLRYQFNAIYKYVRLPRCCFYIHSV